MVGKGVYFVREQSWHGTASSFNVYSIVHAISQGENHVLVSELQNCLWSDRHERTRSFNNLYIGNVSSWKLSIKKYVSYIFYILNIQNCFVSRILAKQTIVLKLNKYFLISSNEQVLSFEPTRQRGRNGKMENSPLFSIHHKTIPAFPCDELIPIDICTIIILHLVGRVGGECLDCLEIFTFISTPRHNIV